MSEKIHIIPPERTRYLAEIAENSDEYDHFVDTQTGIARRMFQLRGTIDMLRRDVGKRSLKISERGRVCTQDNVVRVKAYVEGEPEYLQDLIARYESLREQLDHDCRKPCSRVGAR